MFVHLVLLKRKSDSFFAMLLVEELELSKKQRVRGD